MEEAPILDAEQARARIAAIVESFPEGEARPVAGLHLCLMVREKKFGWYMENHHGDGRVCVECRGLPGVQQAMVEQNGAVYFVPSYSGWKGYVGAWLDVPGVDYAEIADLLYDAYLIACPKSLRKGLAARRLGDGHEVEG